MSQILIVHSIHFYKIYFLTLFLSGIKRQYYFSLYYSHFNLSINLKITKSQQNSTNQARNDLCLMHSAFPVKRYWIFSVLGLLPVVFSRALSSVTDNTFSRACNRLNVFPGLHLDFCNIFFSSFHQWHNSADWLLTLITTFAQEFASLVTFRCLSQYVWILYPKNQKLPHGHNWKDERLGRLGRQ